MRRRVDVELYAGAGGTSEGARRAGAHAVGIEIDADVCATAAAAGHLRVQADVAAYPGDYVLIPFAPCYLETTQTDLLKGTHVVTIKDHRPTRPAEPVPSSPDGGDRDAT